VLEFQLLGPLQLLRDGDEVVVSAPKLRTTLIALVLGANRVVSADHLIDALWPEQPPESARKLVQVYVSQLRSMLGPEEIETVGRGYRLRVEPGTLDAARFEQTSVDGRRALAEGNPELARALTGRALSLWRGAALADVAYEPFAAAEAVRLDDLRLECIEDQLEAELALGHHEAVVPELQRLCADHPLRERARERLALALYRSGRQTEALDVLTEGRRVLREELGLEPGRAHQELEHAILNQDPWLEETSAARATPHSLPTPSSPIVGRTDELAQLGAIVMREDVRIVTISGAGGSGKTRLALELARSAGSSFANGAAFVELASIHDPDLVVGTIARALGVPETPDAPPSEVLATWLRGRDLLLVVDNFEHVIEAAPELSRLLAEASRLTVLVTSRRVLHISGEHVFPLNPLAVDDAVRLFSSRAAARDPSVVDDRETSHVVQAICRRLDCLPLALELAAARTAALGPQLLLDRLVDRVTDLGVGPRDAPARQQTLNDTLRWSTDLLSDEERRSFARLSVFAGGCSIEAAEDVCEASVECLVALIDSSLVQRTTSPSGARLTMLETIREHAAHLLALSGEGGATEARHASYFAALADRTVLKGAAQVQGLRSIDPDLDNLRTAYDRSALAGDDDTALLVATALYRYWYLRGLFREGRDRIGGPLERGAGDAARQAHALRAISGLMYMLGDLDDAASFATRGVDVGTVAGTLEPVMACHTVLGHTTREQGQFAAAQAHFERSAALAAQLGLDEDVMVANTNLGEVALVAGDLAQARSRWEETLAFYGNRDDEAVTFALLGMGAVAHRQGFLDEAVAHFSRAQRLSETAGFTHNSALAFLGLAGVSADRADHAETALLLGRTAALLAATGGGLTGDDADVYERAKSTALAGLGAERMAELLDAGARNVS
jgi:predicted ATPase/DNA-binding SARP family transcriptional activator